MRKNIFIVGLLH